jgi:hypothetical protein
MKKKINKIGTVTTVLLFGAICAIGGYELRSSTNSSNSVLPIAKGGTNANTASEARANLGAQETLVSGTNIKTLNSISLLGSGDISLPWRTTSATYMANLNSYLIFKTSVVFNGLGVIKVYSLDAASWALAHFSNTNNSGGYSIRGNLMAFGTNFIDVCLINSGTYKGFLAIKNISGVIGAVAEVYYNNLNLMQNGTVLVTPNNDDYPSIVTSCITNKKIYN